MILLAWVLVTAPVSQGILVRSADTAIRVEPSSNGLTLASLRSTGSDHEWAIRSKIPFISDEKRSTQSARGSRASVRLNWRFVRSTGSRFTFINANPALELTSEWIGSTNPGPVRHVLTIKNKGRELVALPLQPSLAFDFTSKNSELWWVEKGGQWPSYVGTHRMAMDSGFGVKLRSTPYSNDGEPRGAIPWISIQDTVRKEGWYAGIEFSGRVHQAVKELPGGSRFHVEVGTDPEGPTPYTTVLQPGETFTAPSVFIGCYRGDVDDGSNRLRRWVEKAIRPKVPDSRYPLVTLNSWGSGMAVDDALARSMVKDAADLGMEMYHIDAGWYRTVGDWRINVAKFPKGLAAIADAVHARRMRFGLWTAWTQGGVDDGMSVRNPAMRNWFTRDYPSDWKPSDFVGADACMADRQARSWAMSTLDRVVNDYKIDLLEHDQRMVVESCDRTGHGHTAHPSDVAHHAALGYYAVQDYVRQRHPNLMFEDCVNGGHMVDYGVLRRVHYVSITDTYDPVANRRAFYDTSYALPPSMCECYVADDPGPTLGTFTTMLRSGMMGWFTLMCDPAKWTPAQMQIAKRQIAIYKSWLRPLIRSGNLYHLTERPDGRIWDAIQYYDPATGKGVVYAFRGTEASHEKTLRLRSLDPKRGYRIRFEGRPDAAKVVSGKQLLSVGVTVRINEPGASELVYIEAK